MGSGALARGRALGGVAVAVFSVIAAPRAAFAEDEPATVPDLAAPSEASRAKADEPHGSLPAPVQEVKIVGARTEAERLQQSAEAVNVVDTRKAKEQTVDLGEVLARTQGVAVRRDGGLGSSARFALNGIYDRIPFFLDGVPLELAGYPFGIANVPVNLVERVDIYRGVVPIRFGSDGLGGAVNLVRDQRYDTHAGVSYQAGSFGTQRVTLHGRYRHEPTDLVIGSSVFLDAAKNNYEVDVEIPDAQGRPRPITVPRFHDAYRAYGVNLEAGIVDRPWAKRLLIRGFLSGYEKDLQHNALMTVPFGEVRYGETVYGATAVYEAQLARSVEFEAVASYTHRTVALDDQSPWVYDWTGRRVGSRRIAGEIESEPHDQSIWQKTVFSRARVQWSIVPKVHVVRVATTPTFATRTGEERRPLTPTSRDPLSAERDLFTLVSGLEYELSPWNERLDNVFFVKDYYYKADTEELLPGGTSFRIADSERHLQGIGDALRFRFAPWLYAKVSYEFATRLPRPDEVFGDGILVQPNLRIQPEISHNGNLGPRIEFRRTRLGGFTLDVNAFVRDSDRLIVLLGGDRLFKYENIYSARAVGLENALHWSSPGRYVALDGTLTWQDVRNTATTGTFADFRSDRIPNRPYLFASWGARLRFAGLPGPADTLEPFYHARFVEEFYRGWESQGARAFKQTIDPQLTHNIGLSWIVSRPLARVTSTFEVDNVTDARVFDNFGVQRPGRAGYVKLTVEM
ncbi:MAG TPA: TonB-dependent siderophore myxochelin receptor MxcH [Labilithrix sp.]|nr:TonB-dependent siderophore myxochelin receptor MxcH [Labilithrix sp.]